MCKYSHLSIGEAVIWHITHCGECSADLQIKKLVIYQGHVTIDRTYDMFLTQNSFNCPACGENLNTVIVPCDTGPDVDVSIFSKIEVEMVKLELVSDMINPMPPCKCCNHPELN